MKIQHTKGKWTSKAGVNHGTICCDDGTLAHWYRPDFRTSIIENEGNGYLLGMARTAPHECDDPHCRGNVNRRKLEAAENMRDALVALAFTLNSTAKSGPVCWCDPNSSVCVECTDACNKARAALADYAKAEGE